MPSNWMLRKFTMKTDHPQKYHTWTQRLVNMAEAAGWKEEDFDDNNDH